MKISLIALPAVGLLAALGLATGSAFSATSASEHSPCRPDGADEDRFGYSAADPVSNELPTVYTDGGSHYVGACGGGEGQPVRYIQVNDPAGAASGQKPIVEGQTGVQQVDDVVWAYGPATVWVTGSGTESPNPSCAPAGDDTYGHANGNNVTREFPTVYTDGAQHHVGICGSGGRVQVNEPTSANPVEVEVNGVPNPVVPLP